MLYLITVGRKNLFSYVKSRKQLCLKVTQHLKANHILKIKLLIIKL